MRLWFCNFLIFWPCLCRYSGSSPKLEPTKEHCSRFTTCLSCRRKGQRIANFHGRLDDTFRDAFDCRYIYSVVNYINAYERVFIVIPETFAPLSAFITNALLSFQTDYMKYAYLSVDQLRKDTLLQLTSNLNAITGSEIVCRCDFVCYLSHE